MLEFFIAWLVFGVLVVVTENPLAFFFFGAVTGVLWTVFAMVVKG